MNSLNKPAARRIRTCLPLRHRLTQVLSLLAVGLLIPSPAAANINFYRLFKNRSYQQTGDAPPTTTTGFTGGGDVLFSTAGDVAAGQITSTSPISPLLFGAPSSNSIAAAHSYSTLTALDTDFPNSTTYNYSVSGGLLGSMSAQITTPAADGFAQEIPAFTGSANTQLQTMDVTLPYTLNFASYTPPPGANSLTTFISISRVSDGHSVFGTSVSNTMTSVNLPANTLAPNTAYTATVDFSARTSTASAGFNGATSEMIFDSSASMPFTTPQANIPGPNIQYFRIFKSRTYQQTSNSQPVSPTSFSASLDAFTNTPSDFFGGTVTTPSLQNNIVLNPNFNGSSSFGSNYPSQTAVDAALPSGATYSFQISPVNPNGPLQLGVVTTPASNLFASQVPYFTNGTYNQLQGLNPSGDFNFQVNGYTPAVGINSAPIFISVYRVSDGHFMFGKSGDNTVTTFSMPANTLAANTAYEVFVDDSSRVDIGNAGLYGATSEVAYDSSTALFFTTGVTVNLPGDYNNDGVVDVADYVVFRKNLGQFVFLPNDTTPGQVTAADYDVWRAHFGQPSSGIGSSLGAAVPEPPTFWLATLLCVAIASRRDASTQRTATPKPLSHSEHGR